MRAIHVSVHVAPVHGALSHGDHVMGIAPIKVVHHHIIIVKVCMVVTGMVPLLHMKFLYDLGMLLREILGKHLSVCVFSDTV